MNNFIEKSDELFHTVFGEIISELRFVVGGISLSDGNKIAKAVIYENPYHKIENQNIISFGYFETNDNELANALFKEIKTLAKKKGFNKIVGPINGSTWFDYRLMIANDNDLFFTESKTPEDNIELLKSNGFEVLKNYVSNYSDNLKAFDDRFLNQKEKEINEANWSITNIDLDDLEEELKQIALFSNASFKYNFLYSPIQIDDFVSKYIQVLPQIDTQFVKIIRNENNEIEALMFAFPDLLASKKQFIIKTVARNPNSKIKGLGNYLSQLVTKIAYEEDYTSSIHAYMIQHNPSNAISSIFKSENYRSYQLFVHNI